MRSPLGRCSSKARTIQLAMIVNNTVSERKECKKVHEFQFAQLMLLSGPLSKCLSCANKIGDLLTVLLYYYQSKIVAKSKDLSIFKQNTLY